MVELNRRAQRRLYRCFETGDAAGFVDACLDLLRHNRPLASFFSGAEEVFADMVDVGLQHHIAHQSGFIYLATNPVYGVNVYKIGKTRKAPNERMLTLETSGVLGQFILAGAWPSRDLDRSERRCHHVLSTCRLEGEFFRGDYRELIPVLEGVLQEEAEAMATLQKMVIG